MPQPLPSPSVCLAVSGASGAIYGIRLLRMLLQAEIQVELIYTPAARRVLAEECGIVLGADPAVLWQEAGVTADDHWSTLVQLHDHQNIGGKPASGSAGIQTVIVLPCSLDTLAAISMGRAENLVERAAQVALKEQRRLILCPRETPISKVHLDHMSRLAWAGAVILPACPGFYHQPRRVEDLVDQVCAKVLDVCGIPQEKITRWQGSE